MVSDEKQARYCDPQVNCYERLDCSVTDYQCLLRCHAGIHVFQRDSVEWKEVMEAAGSGLQ